jgi:myo-inositol-1(or 4)-monophosphatase
MVDNSLLDTALEAAAAAAVIVRARYRSPGLVKIKGYRDIVTEADVAAQEAAQAVIAARFPQQPILGEEARRAAWPRRASWRG